MKFSEVTVGQKFSFQNQQFVKIAAEKVSCCRSLNAQNLTNNNKVTIAPEAGVELVVETNEQ